MNLQHFPTPSINYNSKKLCNTGKQLLIGTFSVPADDTEDMNYKVPILTPDIEKHLSVLIKDADMQWVIEQSYGGLYLNVDKHVNPFKYEYTFRVSMLVYVSSEIYTFCHLKHYNNLTQMIK